MTYETALSQAKDKLRAADAMLREELQTYPTPVSGCDAQYSHFIAQRGAISRALSALEAPPFVASPRTLEEGAGVESR